MTTTQIQRPPVKASSRIISLDVFRGITIAFMIMVNDNGSLKYAYWPLKHSAWNGWTPTDQVFPTFLFLVGAATVFSIDSRLARGESRNMLLLHILKRTAILFLLGLVVNGFPHFPLDTLRIYGVLQRIALCYFATGILYLCSRKVVVLATVAAAALAGYWILMRFVPIPGYGIPTHGIPLLDRDANWVAYLDRKIFPGRLYNGTYDPEGLLSDLPSLATTLLGVLTGLWLKTKRSAAHIAAGLFVASIAAFALAMVWNIWFPINKQLWTSSYVLLAAGWALLPLCICYIVIEIAKWNRGWTYPWLVFGSNAIVAYVFSELLASMLFSIHLQYNGAMTTLQDVIYQKYFFSLGNPSFGSLLFSLAYTLFCMLPVAVLYRKKIFVKI